ncbi:MAG: aldo/keto reductase [Acholeplasmatales bacterium]|jgi:predicted oxidoreductase|nr:aldo/keto reductase [Acholeplasmatales bacterium]
MKYVKLGNSDLLVSKVCLGCMRIASKTVEEVEELVKKALDLGVNFFDHADIYGDTTCESIFGEVLKKHPDWREKMIIQTKIGIVKGVMYDFSKERFVNGVDDALKRLNISYIDVLLIHRPDALTDWKEVSDTFKILKESGKVRYFGVSNMNRGQMELFYKFCGFHPVANQLRLSITHSTMIDQGLFVNRMDNESIGRSDGALEYCYLNGITVEPWSVVMGPERVTFIDDPKFPVLNERLDKLAKKYKVTKNCIAIAFLTRHPQDLVPIVGTTSPIHLTEMADAPDIILEKTEWYSLLLHNKVLP